jgi:hypothetical protein
MREEGGTGRFFALGNQSSVGQEDVRILSDQNILSQFKGTPASEIRLRVFTQTFSQFKGAQA